MSSSAPARSTQTTSSRLPISPRHCTGANQFGAALGGPLARDRTFFFVDYQGTRTAAGQTLVTNVPSLADAAATFRKAA